MSRVGRTPIPLPQGVVVELEELGVRISGPLGELFVPVPKGLVVEKTEGVLRVRNPTGDPQLKAMHGTLRSLLANAVKGVSEGHAKTLLLHHPKSLYRASLLEDGRLELRGLLSYPVRISPPQGIRFEVPEPTRVIIFGADKAFVGQIAAQIRAVRPLFPYFYEGGKKPMGIGYEWERARKSVVKSTGKGR